MFRPDEPEAVPLALAPSPSSAGAEERSQRLKELLSGQIEAARLPLAATEPGATFDPSLFHGLTTERERPSSDPLSDGSPPRRFRLDVGEAQLLSGNVDPKRLYQAVSERRGGFRLCYQEALNDKYSGAQASAKVIAVFNVDADGRPASIRADGDAPKALFDCVKKHGMAIAIAPAPGALRFRITIETKSTD